MVITELCCHADAAILLRLIRIGTVEIRLGDDSLAFYTVNNIVWSELYDGGFFPIDTNINGRYLTFRRIS